MQYFNQVDQASNADPHAMNTKGRPLTMPDEPDLPEVVEADKVIVRNVLFMIWALHQQDTPCIGWHVQTKNDGYLVVVSFSTTFSIALPDLQAIVDVNPLRIDSVVVRNPENNENKRVGAVVVVKVLNQQQPLRITDTEIVRVKKRHRFGGSWFGR